ncbi:MAG: hypothetical protein V4576_02955 [Patescibacteria group bacterium]
MTKENPNIQEGQLVEAPAASQEGGKFNSVGHERMGKLGAVLKGGAEVLAKAALKTGKGVFKLFKGALKVGAKAVRGGANLLKSGVKEGAATMLSIDDIAVKGFMKVKDAAGKVKEALANKTREGVTAGRDAIAAAYEGTKQKGKNVMEWGRNKIRSAQEFSAKRKLESMVNNTRMMKEASEAKTKKLQERYAQEMFLLGRLQEVQ